MGFKDILGGIGTMVSDTVDAQRHHSKLMDYKRQMLQKLSTSQLKNIIDHFGVDPTPMQAPTLNFEPTPELWGGTPPKKPKRPSALTRDNYLEAVMGRVPANDVIEYCRKRGFREIEVLARGRQEYIQKYHIDNGGKKLPIDEKVILEQQPKIQPSEAVLSRPESITKTYEPSSFVKELINTINAMPRVRKFKWEREFHTAMLYYLQNKYPCVKDEPDRRTADILVDNVAIELKHFDNRSNNSGEISRLIGQMTEFADKYDAFIIVIYGGTENDRQRILAADKSSKHNVSVVLL